jgi:hypothetical protein
MNTMSAYRLTLVQGIEDMIGADDVGQAMAVQIGLRDDWRYEHQHDTVASSSWRSRSTRAAE